MFQVVDGEVVVAVEAYEIMAVALVVAEEEVLAVHAAIVFPPAFCLLYGFAFGMVVAAEWNVVFFKVVENLFLSFGYLFHSSSNYFLQKYNIIAYKQKLFDNKSLPL